MRTPVPTPDFTFEHVCRVLKDLVAIQLDTDLGKPGEAIEIAMCSIIEVTSSRRVRSPHELRQRAERVLGYLREAEDACAQLPATLKDAPIVQKLRAELTTLSAIFAGRSAVLRGELPIVGEKLPC